MTGSDKPKIILTEEPHGRFSPDDGTSSLLFRHIALNDHGYVTKQGLPSVLYLAEAHGWAMEVRETPKVLFRRHRETLAESMDGVKEILATERALREHLWLGNIGEITVTHQIMDERNGWDTHLVAVNGNAVGFLNGPLVR